MKKRFLMLSILVLTALSSFCQTGYPSKLVIDEDTIACVTAEQATKIAVTYIEKDKYKELSDSLKVRYYDIYNLKMDCQNMLKIIKQETNNLLQQKNLLEIDLGVKQSTIDNQDKKIKCLKITNYVVFSFAGIVSILYLVK